MAEARLVNDTSFAPFLAASDVVDHRAPTVQARAMELAAPHASLVAVAKACFEWVRDDILHSRDHRKDPLTCIASDVLRHGTGYCFAKSHLLVALLRANGIPAGFVYQRLSRDDNGPPYTLHGLVAVHLDGFGWYRIDPRGNRAGIDAQFTPPTERFAFTSTAPGEALVPGVYAEPLPEVVGALRRHTTQEAFFYDLPDCLPPLPLP